MPHVAINNSSGPASVHYTISTPKNASAEEIDPKLPTVILIHPVYIAQVIFQEQFSDPQLRRFNLIAIDSRGYGETIGSVPSTWRRWNAAEDVFHFMAALRLPACHILGVSMGACTALQAAVSYPERILSITMVSPLSIHEPREVAEGRQEIYDYWAEGFKDPEKIDELALHDAVHGALQLGFHSQDSSLIQAISAITIPQARKNFSPDKLEEFHTTSVKFFTDRPPHTKEALSRIRCPVQLIHCKGDIAYPLEYAEELRDLIASAGVEVNTVVVEGAPHFGHVTHAEEINTALHDFVINCTKFAVPPAPTCISSPFDSALAEVGWTCGDNDFLCSGGPRHQFV